MALAVNSYKSGHFTSIRGAADTYDIPESTLQTRLKGTRPQRENRSVNCSLTTTEELTLINWILSMDERGLPVRTVQFERWLIYYFKNGLVQTRIRRVQVGHSMAI